MSRRVALVRIDAAWFSCYLLLTFLTRLLFSSWWWRRYVPPKHRFLQEPHGVTSQKTGLLIVTAVKTSNLASHYQFNWMVPFQFTFLHGTSDVLMGLLSLHSSSLSSSWRTDDVSNLSAQYLSSYDILHRSIQSNNDYWFSPKYILFASPCSIQRRHQ
jgi:hypothetical protein